MQWLTTPLSAIRTLPDLNLSSSNYNGKECPMCLLQFNGLLLFSQIWFYWHPLMLATGFSRLQANCKKKRHCDVREGTFFQGKRSGFHLLKFHLLELSDIGWVGQNESQLTHLWDRKGFILTLSQKEWGLWSWDEVKDIKGYCQLEQLYSVRGIWSFLGTRIINQKF